MITSQPQRDTFPEPISVDIRLVGLRTFALASELRSWISIEEAYWRELNGKIGTHNPFNSDTLINPNQSLTNQIISNIDTYLTGDASQSSQALVNIRGLLQRYNSPGILFSRSSPAIQIGALAERNPIASWLALAFHLENAEPITLASPARIIPLLKALDIIRDQAFDARAEIDSLSRNHKELNDQWSRDFSARIQMLDETKAKVRSIARGWLKRARVAASTTRSARAKHEKEMADMRVAFSTEQKLRAAERMWAEKKKANRRRATVALYKFGVSIISGGLLIALVYYFLMQALPLRDGLSIPQGIIYAIPAVILVWVLRIFATEHRVNQRLADDAEERMAMVMTFKALEYKEKATDSERALILAALFRPSPGTNEETVPMPVLEAVLNKIK